MRSKEKAELIASNVSLITTIPNYMKVTRGHRSSSLSSVERKPDKHVNVIIP
jgi:hypothetical protein